jgi:hypothetical protein
MHPQTSALMLWELTLRASSASPLSTFGAFVRAVITSRSASTFPPAPISFLLHFVCRSNQNSHEQFDQVDPSSKGGHIDI